MNRPLIIIRWWTDRLQAPVVTIIVVIYIWGHDGVALCGISLVILRQYVDVFDVFDLVPTHKPNDDEYGSIIIQTVYDIANTQFMIFSSSVYQIFSSKIIPQTKNLKKKHTHLNLRDQTNILCKLYQTCK